MMANQFRDVYLHMEWADSMIWKEVLDSDVLRSDEYILKSLFHLHEVQHHFLNSWTGKPMERYSQESFESAPAISAWGQEFYGELAEFLDSVRDDALPEPHILPWATYFGRRLGVDAAETTLMETMHQLSSHSMHHRGQVMRRFRELDLAPPGLDYIVWAWMGRPNPVWNAA